MKVPYVALERSFKRHNDIYMKVAEEVWTTGQIYNGEYVSMLEERIAHRCDRKYGVAFSSCTDALYFSLLANNISDGDEVIVPSYSFVASATCILRANAIPVFVDIDPNTFMVTADEIEQHITKKTKAIIAVDLFGHVLNFEEIEKVAKKHSLFLIEDAAQSFGAIKKGRSVGSMGNIGCISFDPVKNLGSLGSGGMLVTDDFEIARNAKAWRNHGKFDNSDTHDFLGVKSKMTTMEAAILFMKLNSLASENNLRSLIANMYIDGLKDIDNISLPQESFYPESIWHKFVILVDNKYDFMKYLSDNGIGTKDIYPRPIYKEPVFSRYDINCINAEYITQRNIALPIYPYMTEDEVLYVIETIRKFYT